MYSQYTAGETLIHRMPACAKIIGMIIFILAGLTVQKPVFAAVFFCLSIVIAFAAGIHPKKLFLKTRYILVLLLTGFVFNALFRGWDTALPVFLRLYAIVILAQVFIFTTAPEELMECAENKFHINKEYLVSIMIAAAFLPILQDSFHEIRTAQEARGADWMHGSLKSKIKGMIPLLVPMFRFTLQKAETLGEALTIKGYSSQD